MAEHITKDQARDALLYLDDDLAFVPEDRIEEISNAWNDEIRRLPPADVVEVVRCKDCKNLYPDDTGKLHWCDCHRMFVGLDDFCNYGKRKDGGENK